MPATQKDTIIQLLNAAEWVCGGDLRDAKVQEYRTRINELRIDGFTIEARRCTQHQHKAGMQEWHLAVKASDASQNTPGRDLPARASNYVYPKPLPPICCSLARADTGFHTRGCETQKEPV